VTNRDAKQSGIDFEEMEAALKRAAYKAIYGTHEERAGRFASVGKSDRDVSIGVERVRHAGSGKTDKWKA
jgi:hypothetical protein